MPEKFHLRLAGSRAEPRAERANDSVLAVKKKHFGNLFLSLTILLVTIGGLEIGTRIIDAFDPPEPRTWHEYRKRIPPAYRGAAYDVVAIVDEARQVKWKTGHEFGWLPEDRSGHYINISQRKRQTAYQPAGLHSKIFMFGGSTMMSTDVPDSLTIPSQFQSAINKRWERTFIVENLGATTITSGHQLFRLMELTTINPGDVVVFYDGVNDIYQALYNQRIGGNMADSNRERIRSWSILKRFSFWFYHKLHRHSALVARFLNPIKRDAKPLNISSSTLSRLEEHYYETIARADRWTRSRGGTFYHFLQPNLFSLDSRTPNEEALTRSPQHDAQLSYVYTVGNRVLQNVVSRLRARGIKSMDITGAFNARRREIFLDFCHVNEEGNRLIAQTIEGVLRSDLGSRQSGAGFSGALPDWAGLAR